MTVPLIEVDGLRKDFAVTRKTGVLRRARAVVHAVDGLTFSVERGEIVGYIVPIAFVAYFPSLYILGKPDPLGLPPVLQFAAPVVAVVTAIAAGLVWRVAVRHYQSAGG